MHPMNLTIIGAAYLLGSVPFGFLLVLLVRKEDIREKGSGNIGATNVLRSGAKGLGALTFLLDAGKGFTAVLLAETLPPQQRRNHRAKWRDPGWFFCHRRPHFPHLARV